MSSPRTTAESWQSSPEEVDDIGAQLGDLLPAANLDSDEAMYKQLLDMVDISGPDPDDDFYDDDDSTVGGDDESVDSTDNNNNNNQSQKERTTSMTGLKVRDAVVAITDQQVLDMFVVFGKPVIQIKKHECCFIGGV
jgi:hypothetical protein